MAELIKAQVENFIIENGDKPAELNDEEFE